MDILDFFRGRYSFAKLRRLIRQLPRRSRLQLALAEDDEFADRMLDDGADDISSSAPSLGDWTPEVAYLASVVDRLGEVVSAVLSSSGRKPPKMKPLERPRTAFDRARRRRTRAGVDSLVAEVRQAQRRRSGDSEGVG